MGKRNKFSKHGESMSELERSAWRRFCASFCLPSSTVSNPENLIRQREFIKRYREKKIL